MDVDGHDWKPVRTWKPKRRSYHKSRQFISWRTEWKCCKCGILRQDNHVSRRRDPIHGLDSPSPHLPVFVKEDSEMGQNLRPADGGGMPRVSCEEYIILATMVS